MDLISLTLKNGKNNIFAVRVFVCLGVCVSAHLFVCLFVCLSVCTSCAVTLKKI